MKKYKFNNETKKEGNIILHRVVALRDFSEIKAGDIGGWIEKEENLSPDGDAWVYSDAMVYGDAKVYDNAVIC